jgi:hypothetical protein
MFAIHFFLRLALCPNQNARHLFFSPLSALAKPKQQLFSFSLIGWRANTPLFFFFQYPGRRARSGNAPAKNKVFLKGPHFYG